MTSGNHYLKHKKKNIFQYFDKRKILNFEIFHTQYIKFKNLIIFDLFTYIQIKSNFGNL